jgi:hypothetical protein
MFSAKESSVPPCLCGNQKSSLCLCASVAHSSLRLGAFVALQMLAKDNRRYRASDQLQQHHP